MLCALPEPYYARHHQRRAAVGCVRIAFKWVFDGFRADQGCRGLDLYLEPTQESWVQHEVDILSYLGWEIGRFFAPVGLPSALATPRPLLAAVAPHRTLKGPARDHARPLNSNGMDDANNHHHHSTAPTLTRPLWPVVATTALQPARHSAPFSAETERRTPAPKVASGTHVPPASRPEKKKQIYSADIHHWPSSSFFFFCFHGLMTFWSRSAGQGFFLCLFFSSCGAHRRLLLQSTRSYIPAWPQSVPLPSPFFLHKVALARRLVLVWLPNNLRGKGHQKKQHSTRRRRSAHPFFLIRRMDQKELEATKTLGGPPGHGTAAATRVSRQGDVQGKKKRDPLAGHFKNPDIQKREKEKCKHQKPTKREHDKTIFSKRKTKQT
ncbi:hypothetical protein TW95_gp1440 [Pandoravirus inopinatum]|uniref:Uncharacterized protein n=1 Tax=Pandoravirus inopinatum TaxID=1605721 RepID=A0A0B5J3N4_9VIRU|nr:hypothetical protein TW95_gp1440 [Pandoravirus inopinatum]AJF98174.1 hypothetical protein [Pandoravirus inopinatum]